MIVQHLGGAAKRNLSVVAKWWTNKRGKISSLPEGEVGKPQLGKEKHYS